MHPVPAMCPRLQPTAPSHRTCAEGCRNDGGRGGLCTPRPEVVFREARDSFPQTTSYFVHCVLLTGFTAPPASPEHETPVASSESLRCFPLFHQCYVTDIKNTSLVWGKKKENNQTNALWVSKNLVHGLGCEMVKTNLYWRKKQFLHQLELSVSPQILHCLEISESIPSFYLEHRVSCADFTLQCALKSHSRQVEQRS